MASTKYSYGIDSTKLEGTLVQSQLVVFSNQTKGLCKIRDADMRAGALKSELYSDLSCSSVHPGCWLAEKAPDESDWTVGKVHNVVSSDACTVKLGVYYPGDTKGDAAATVALTTAGSAVADASGHFGARSTRPQSSADHRGVATSMVFFKPNGLRYPDMEGVQCLMSSARLHERGLAHRTESLDARESALATNEAEVQRAFDVVTADRLADQEKWADVKHEFDTHREAVLAADMADMSDRWQARETSARADIAIEANVRATREGHMSALLQCEKAKTARSAQSLLEANATVQTHVQTAANTSSLLAAEKRNVALANKRLGQANTAIQAHFDKAQHATSRLAAQNNTVIRLTESLAEAEAAGANGNNTAGRSTSGFAALEKELLHVRARLAEQTQELAVATASNVYHMHTTERHTAPQDTRSRLYAEAGGPAWERTGAEAETLAWNRSRDEKLRPLARVTRPPALLDATQEQFVEHVINHMQLATVSAV